MTTTGWGGKRRSMQETAELRAYARFERLRSLGGTVRRRWAAVACELGSEGDDAGAQYAQARGLDEARRAGAASGPERLAQFAALVASGVEAETAGAITRGEQ